MDIVSKNTVKNTVSLERLGQRLRARREFLGLTREQVSRSLNVNYASLINWEKALPRPPIDAKNDKAKKESALEDLLQVPPGWLRDETIIVDVPKQVTIKLSNAGTVAAEISEIGIWLVRANTARRTFDRNALSQNERRAADIFSQRFGTFGEGPSTLQMIGDRFGITRERVRQIVEKMSQRAHGISVSTPILDSVLERVREKALTTILEMEKELAPLLGEHLSLRAADRFAREIMGKRFLYFGSCFSSAIPVFSSDSVSVDPITEDLRARAVRSASLAMIRSCGAAHIAFVTGAATQIHAQPLTTAMALEFLRLLGDFEWLDERSGWFWMGPSTDNRLVTTAMKILAVADRKVDAEEIHCAMARPRRLRYDQDRSDPDLIDVPVMIVREVMQRVPGVLTSQCDDFSLVESIQPDAVLSVTELAVYRCIKSHGGVVARRTLQQNLSETGIVSLPSLNLVVDSSPITTRIDRGVYGLCGHSIDSSSLIEQALQARGERMIKPDNNGHFVIKFNLTAGMIRNYIFELPSSVARYVEAGQYELEGASSTLVLATPGKCRVSGLVAKIRQLGFAEGDWIELIIDQTAKRISCRTIDCPIQPV